MSKLGFAHLIFALAALVSGAFVLLRRKGTLSHKRVGYVYAFCMIGLNGTALLIYRLFRRPGPFHVLAAVSLATLLAGLFPALRRRAGWLERHYRLMAWSYVGLCAAALAEIAVRLPFIHSIGWRFGIAAFTASALVAVVGGRVIERRRKSALAAVLEAPGYGR
jgi:uncharacterized membrane protein